MTARLDTARSLPDRQHLGQQLRTAREAVGMTQADLGRIAGIRQSLVWTIETASRDVFTSSLVDAAAAAGRCVVLAAEHHLPLLDLTEAEVACLLGAAAASQETHGTSATLRSALDKLTTTEETPDD